MVAGCPGLFDYLNDLVGMTLSPTGLRGSLKFFYSLSERRLRVLFVRSGVALHWGLVAVGMADSFCCVLRRVRHMAIFH